MGGVRGGHEGLMMRAEQPWVMNDFPLMRSVIGTFNCANCSGDASPSTWTW